MSTETLTGRTLDAAIGKALSYQAKYDEARGYWFLADEKGQAIPSWGQIFEQGVWEMGCPRFSESWDAAKLVVEAMRARGHHLMLWNPPENDQTWVARFLPKYLVQPWQEAEGPSAPEAIAQCALRALEDQAAREGRDG